MILQDVIRLIPTEFKGVFRRCILLAFVKGLLNLVGFAMFIPVLFLFLSPEAIMGNLTVARIASSLGVDSQLGVMLLCCLAIIVVVALKNFLLVLINRSQNSAYVGLFKTYSRSLFGSYMNKGLLYVKEHNTGTLTSNVCLATYTFVFNMVAPVVSIFSELLLILLIIALTAVIDIYVVLILIAFIVPVTLLYKVLLRDSLSNLGKEEYRLRRNQIRIVQESLKGYAEVSVNNAIAVVFGRYNNELEAHAGIKRKIENRVGAISGMLEVVVIVLLVVLVVATSYMTIDRQALALVLGIFGFALIKVVTSARAIINNYAMIKTNGHTLAILDQRSDEVVPGSGIDSGVMTFEDSINVSNLKFSYDGSKEIIKNLSFDVRKGERIGIKGESGSGKSTLFYLLLGLYQPTSGTIEIDGERLEGANISPWQNRVGFVSQDVFISDSTIADNIAMGDTSVPPDNERLEYAVRMASLGKFVEGLPEGMETQIGEAGSKLSGGLKQRIGIARALYKNADVLFFDEATSSLDSKTEKEIMDSIRFLSQTVQNLTILMIAHNDSSLADCDRIINIDG